MNRQVRRLALIVAALVVAVTACATEGRAQSAERSQQEQSSIAMVNNQPLPVVTWSQLRQNLIEIEQSQATATQTTSFFFNQGIADPIWSCPSIGYAIPNTASLSNPTQVIWTGSNGGVATGGQMDPNGVYTPTSSTGTYVVCVDNAGRGYAAYWEGFVLTVSGPAAWDREKHTATLTGAPTAKFSTSR